MQSAFADTNHVGAMHLVDARPTFGITFARRRTDAYVPMSAQADCVPL